MCTLKRDWYDPKKWPHNVLPLCFPEKKKMLYFLGRIASPGREYILQIVHWKYFAYLMKHGLQHALGHGTCGAQVIAELWYAHCRVAYTYFNIKQHIYTLDRHKTVHVELLSLEAKCPCRGLKCEVNFIILNCTNKQKRKLICIIFPVSGQSWGRLSLFSAVFFSVFLEGYEI